MNIELAAVRALLKKIEWEGDKGKLDYIGACPCCEGNQTAYDLGYMKGEAGHKPNCELAALLGDKSDE